MPLVVGCARCGGDVPVSNGLPRISGAGVQLVCPPCDGPGEVGDSTAIIAVNAGAIAVPRRTLALVGASAALFAGALLGPSRAADAEADEAPRMAALTDDDIPSEPGASRFAVAAAETAPAAALARGYAGDQPVDLVWYHPLSGPRRMPVSGDRRFGAGRPGNRPDECGRGHCGVDLGQKVGEVIHAVQPGVIRKVDRVGARRGGRYVVIDHAGGYASHYFHLDRIHPSLVVGIEVAAGEPLGTLGASGILHSEAHLHFAVSRVEGEQGTEDAHDHYVDPEPMLARAVLLDEPAPMPPRAKNESIWRPSDAAETDAPLESDSPVDGPAAIEVVAPAGDAAPAAAAPPPGPLADEPQVSAG